MTESDANGAVKVEADDLPAFSATSIRGVPRGSARIRAWHGLHGYLSHFTWGPLPLVLCGQPIALDCVISEDDVITCRGCCRLLIKRNFRGA